MQLALNQLKSRYCDLARCAENAREELYNRLNELELNEQRIQQLLAWLQAAEHHLQTAPPVTVDIAEDDEENDEAVQKCLEIVNSLLEAHQHFENDMLSKQPEYEIITRSAKRVAPTPSTRSMSPNRSSSPSAAIRSPLLSPKTPRSQKTQSDRSRREKGKRSTPSESQSDTVPLQGLQYTDPRVEQVHTNWRSVWLMAVERRAAIQAAIDEIVQVFRSVI